MRYVNKYHKVYIKSYMYNRMVVVSIGMIFYMIMMMVITNAEMICIISLVIPILDAGRMYV